METIISNKKLYSDIKQKVPWVLKKSASRLLVDLVFTRPGKYEITLNYKSNGKYTLEAGFWEADEVFKSIEPIKLILDNNTKSQCIGFITITDTDINNRRIFYMRAKDPVCDITVNELIFNGPSKVIVDDIKSPEDSRKRRHASAAFTTGFIDINIGEGRYFYRELCVTQARPNTYITFAFPTGYIGLASLSSDNWQTGLPEKPTGAINFSVWNADEKESKMILPNKRQVFRNFDHEGFGLHSHYPVNLYPGFIYGLLVKFEYPEKEKTNLTAYAINLGPHPKFYKGEKFIDKQNDNELKIGEWVHMATIQRQSITNIKKVKNSSAVGGFIENTGQLNGHTLNRKLLVGNDWGSVDGINWIPAYKMSYDCKDKDNSTCKPYPEYRSIEVGIGGQVKSIYGDEYEFDLPENPETPSHLKNFLSMPKRMD